MSPHLTLLPLHQAVVSALVDPDTIVIKRDHSNMLSIKSSTIGKKSKKISVNNEKGGTSCQSLSAKETSELSISQEQCLKLAEIGVHLDQLYDAARDIEWAVVRDQIYLLQCRPVTALHAWTDFELTHELGN